MGMMNGKEGGKHQGHAEKRKDVKNSGASKGKDGQKCSGNTEKRRCQGTKREWDADNGRFKAKRLGDNNDRQHQVSTWAKSRVNTKDRHQGSMPNSRDAGKR